MEKNDDHRSGLFTPAGQTSIETTVGEKLTHSEIRQRAKAWYERQIEIIAKAHGDSWPTHRDWIDSYLKEEIRQRLWDLGWRPKP
ncbi:MAG: hypothetical protein ACRYGA_07850 [Janthinobacterium lividum]